MCSCAPDPAPATATATPQVVSLAHYTPSWRDRLGREGIHKVGQYYLRAGVEEEEVEEENKYESDEKNEDDLDLETKSNDKMLLT